MKNILLYVLAGSIALGAGFYVHQRSLTLTTQHTESLLSFRFPDEKGQIHDINEWQGQIRVINFWATWCPPCLKEIPELMALQEQYQDAGLQIIGLAVEDAEPVREFLIDHPVNYPILIGGDGAINLSRQLGNIINAIPFTLVINQQGQIIYRHPGELTRAKLIDVLSELDARFKAGAV
jgi:thiol-disulfide isomerase/thioredoxin